MKSGWRTCVVFAMSATSVSMAQVTGLSLTQRSVTNLSTSNTTDQNAQSVSITGLSGLTYAGGNTFWAVMDNSDKLVRMNVNFTTNGSIASATVAGGLTVAQSKDHEGIAITPGGASVFVSEESTPAVHEYRLSDGALLQTLPLPAVYGNRRTNLGLEALSRSGSSLWTANEEALSVDGNLSDTSSGTTLRLQRFSVSGSTATAGAQYAYTTAPIHKAATDVPPRDVSDLSRSGLADFVALPDGRLLTLERSFARADFIVADAGSDYQTRIYLVDPTGATDISGFSGLTGQSFTAVQKSASPLWSNTTGAFSGGIGNLEGLTLGPQLANGNWTLLGVVDDGDPISDNALVSFELVGPIPEPSSMLAGAVAAIAILRRRRCHPMQR